MIMRFRINILLTLIVLCFLGVQIKAQVKVKIQILDGSYLTVDENSPSEILPNFSLFAREDERRGKNQEFEITLLKSNKIVLKSLVNNQYLKWIPLDKSSSSNSVLIAKANKVDSAAIFELVPKDAYYVVLNVDNHNYDLYCGAKFGKNNSYTYLYTSPQNEPDNLEDSFLRITNLDNGQPFEHGIKTPQTIKTYTTNGNNSTILVPLPNRSMTQQELTSLLGMGYDEYLDKPIRVFDNSAIRQAANNQSHYKANFSRIDDDSQMSINAKYFSLSGELGEKISKRYANFAITLTDHSLTFEHNKDTAKTLAKLYVSAIRFGWGVNYRMSGDASSFHTAIAATFGKEAEKFGMDKGGAFDSKTSNSKLSIDSELWGLTPKGDSLPAALTLEDINKFKRLEPPPPIFIEYTVLNNFDARKIRWFDPKIVYTLDEIQIRISSTKNGKGNWDSKVLNILSSGNSTDPDVVCEIKIGDHQTTIGPIKTLDFKKENLKLQIDNDEDITITLVDRDGFSNDSIGVIRLPYKDLKKWSRQQGGLGSGGGLVIEVPKDSFNKAGKLNIQSAKLTLKPRN